MTSSLPEMPVMPLREVVIFPHYVQPLFVGRTSSVNLLDSAWNTQTKRVFLVTQKNPDAEEPSLDDLYKVGVVGRILQRLPLPDGTIKVLCEGLYRAKLEYLKPSGNFNLTNPIRLAETTERPTEIIPLIKAVHEALDDASGLRASPESILSIKALKDPGELADAIAPLLKCDFKKKQQLLEILDGTTRLEAVYENLEEEKALLQVEKRIKNRVKLQMEHNQKEYYLTEQIKAINKEMGREQDPQAELDQLEKRIREANLSDEAREKALAETGRLRNMTPMAAEYAVARNYIDWILALPWKAKREIEIDINQARNILDHDHFGLEKAKERILEYLAVQKLSNSLRGPILCLAGPPGIGKTSLARSIANATGREFIRLALGGVRDEAEIRGHRRTYVGALPGKIIQSMKRVSSSNPLFCLDEIDKLASDYRGDPASALLEVLDPEQNYAFTDHYLDLEYDLSNVFFITTANTLHTIPAPLLDRMEVINLPSYLETEKKHIARNFLIPRQLEAHGLKKNSLRISDNALEKIIELYTKESGVRGLEREIATLCRKAAVQQLEKNRSVLNVSIQSLLQYLGPPRYHHEKREIEPKVGVSAGLAYSQNGGEILFVETSIMNGNGQVVTTGQLGEVMTESAKAALTYVRSRAEDLGLKNDFYKNIDIHIHVPSGATPKDGPSAGITLATSITSALLKLPVRNDVAMTGEISLRGRVLPIGGLREKLLAAKRGGIRKVILPKANERDLEEIPQEAKKDLELVLVENVDEVLPLALAAEKEKIFSGKKIQTV